MVFRFKERRTSRRMGQTPPYQERLYVAAGSSDELFIRAHAFAQTPTLLNLGTSVLFRQDIELEPQSSEIWHVRVPYGPQDRAPGTVRVGFDTSGATIQIKGSLSTVERYAADGEPAATNHGGLINRNHETGEVEGTEIVSANLKLNVRIMHPPGIMTLARVKHLHNYTGMVNSSPFLGFAAGEVLFLGATGDDLGVTEEVETSYALACSPNLQDQVIAGIENVTKQGWDLIWLEYRDRVVDGKPTSKITHLHVERVYRRAPLALALGFGA